MQELVSRCQSCGFEQPSAFAKCPVCLGTSSWWCGDCERWSTVRTCFTCAGILEVPDELRLGSHPVGARFKVQVRVRNLGKKLLQFNVVSDDAAVSLLTRNLSLLPREEGFVFAVLEIAAGPIGPRVSRIRYETPLPLETLLQVEVVPSLVRLEFVPPELVVRKAQPGLIVHRNLTVTNTGNVAIAAKIELTEPWLGVLPTRLTLAAGESCALKVIARTRKTDFGSKSAEIRISPSGELAFSAQVRLLLPEPRLEAAPVEFGEIQPGFPRYETLTIHNAGSVRVACRLVPDQSWLSAIPSRINLPAGGKNK